MDEFRESESHGMDVANTSVFYEVPAPDAVRSVAPGIGEVFASSAAEGEHDRGRAPDARARALNRPGFA